MLHFCFFSYEISPFTPGGVGTYITSIAINLSSLGNKVTIVLDVDKNTFQLVKESSSSQSIDGNRIDFLMLSELISEDILSRDLFPSDAHWKSYQFMVAAELVHSNDSVDVLEFVDYCGAAYYSLLRRSEAPEKMPRHILIRLHNTIELITKCSSFSFYNSRTYDFWLERASISLADRILSPGINYLNDLVNPIYNIPENRVIISPLCRQLLPKVCDGISGKNIVFFGRVSTYKGLDIFLQAMAIICVDDSISSLFDQIRIIGPKEGITSEDEEAILNYAKNIPDNKIHFLGNLNENDLIEEFSRAMFAVFPNRCESFGYAAHEAHMMGVPLVLSMTPAFIDHFSDGESALFFDQKTHNLISTIQALILDPALRQRLSDSVLLHRDRYNNVKFGPEIDEYINVPKKLNNLIDYQSKQILGLSDLNLTIIFFCHLSYRAESYQYIESLIKNKDGVDVLVLCESEKQGHFNAFGKAWEFVTTDKVNQNIINSGLVLLLSDEILIQPSFIDRAKQIMSRLPMVGAVLPIEFKDDNLNAKFGRAADIFFVNDSNVSKSLPLLLRVSKETTFEHFFRDRSAYTALTLLMECRESGRAIIDDILPSFVNRSVGYPLFDTANKSDLSNFVKKNITSFYDYELATTMIDSVNQAPSLEFSDETTSKKINRYYRDIQLGIHDVLYIHAIKGDLQIFSVIDSGSSQEIDWNCIHINGSYSFAYYNDRSGGALILNEGASLYVEKGSDMVFNVALGPSFEVFAMVSNNRGLLVDIKHHSFSSCFFVPNALFEIVRSEYYEMSDRTYSLYSYRNALHCYGNYYGDKSRSKPKHIFYEGVFDNFLTFIYPFIYAIELDRHNRSLNLVVDEIIARVHFFGNNTSVFYGIEWIDVVVQLLADFDFIHAEIVLRPSAIWGADKALHLLNCIKKTSRFRNRITFTGPSTLQTFFSSGVAFNSFTLNGNNREIPCECSDFCNKVNVVIDFNLDGEVYMGHIASVVKILHYNGIFIDCIFVPSNCPPQDRLFEIFGLAHLMRYYSKIEDINVNNDNLTIYLNPFPFGANIVNVYAAIQNKWLTVMSFYESDLICLTENEYVHAVTFWEDVELISQYLLRVINHKILGHSEFQK